jgi:peptide/nickel transport system permease protein
MKCEICVSLLHWPAVLFLDEPTLGLDITMQDRIREFMAFFMLLVAGVTVFVSLAPYTRLYRSFFLDEINQDYVRTARAKGVSENRVLFTHVLRNAMIPVLTNLALQLPGVFVGSFLIETFFSIPGLGREILLAVNRSDYPVIQAMTVYLAVLTMVINLTADILYRAVDPRVVLK